MAVAFGLAPDAGGTGTTPGDLQQVIRAEYETVGVLSGYALTPSTSGMSITVGAGVAVVPVGAGAVKAPTPQATVVLAAAPATGSRTDTIYVEVPGSPGGQGTVKVASGGDAPAGTVRVEQWVVPAGAANAAAGWRARAGTYAVPRGLGRQIIWDWQDGGTNGYGVAVPSGVGQSGVTLATASLNLETDRNLEIRIKQSIAAQPGGPRGAFQWYIDSNLLGTIHGPVLPYDESPASPPIHGCSYMDIFSVALPRGLNTLTFRRQQVTGGTAMYVAGVDPTGTRRPSNRIQVVDLGVTHED